MRMDGLNRQQDWKEVYRVFNDAWKEPVADEKEVEAFKQSLSRKTGNAKNKMIVERFVIHDLMLGCWTSRS